MKRTLGIATASFTLLMCMAPASAAPAHHPNSWFANCTALHKHWPHGVGKEHAHDHTSGRAVTDFKRDTHLYLHAVSINSDLDRDKDGIACEKA